MKKQYQDYMLEQLQAIMAIDSPAATLPRFRNI